MAADEAAIFFQLAEIERQVRHAGRQDAARRTARQIALENMAIQHAAGALDQLIGGGSGRRQHDPGALTRPDTE